MGYDPRALLTGAGAILTGAGAIVTGGTRSLVTTSAEPEVERTGAAASKQLLDTVHTLELRPGEDDERAAERFVRTIIEETFNMLDMSEMEMEDSLPPFLHDFMSHQTETMQGLVPPPLAVPSNLLLCPVRIVF